MSLKYIIPIQNIEQIEISIKSCNIKSNYYLFSIKLLGVIDGEIKLTGDTIDIINEECKKIIRNLKG